LTRLAAAALILSAVIAQTPRSAKAIFYDAGRLGAPPPAGPGMKLRPITIAPHEVNGGGSLPCGMHYWLEDATGTPVSMKTARATPGKYTLHVRYNNETPGLLSIWDVSGDGRELTPRFDSRWSGYRMPQREYRVPGEFEFSSSEAAPHLILIWVRSQTEVPRDAAHARTRLLDIPWFFNNVSETDDSTPGEIGTYVVSRSGGPVAAEIVFGSARE
jgi:hypothetical protein